MIINEPGVYVADVESSALFMSRIDLRTSVVVVAESEWYAVF